MITQQAQHDYLNRMFSLAHQGAILIPAQRRYFMRQMGMQDQDVARARFQQHEIATRATTQSGSHS